MRSWLGLVRSLFVYWRPGRQQSLRRMYAPMVGAGDLVFDIGAHLGDRSVAFAALGARVVAVEPQPHVARWLRRLIRGNALITLRTEAVGRAEGTARLAVSRRTPTVSTLAHGWRRKVSASNPGFGSVRWDEEVDVLVTTLDALIATYGAPRFCKIDVEGHEPEVLAGLSRAIPGLSLEFVSGDLDATTQCVAQLRSLGPYTFNAILGEERSFVFEEWQTAEEILGWLADGAADAASGDVYARLHPDVSDV